MKKSLKDKWIAALRSGDYQQCQGYLQRNGRFCCLGVLCDIVDRDGWIVMDGTGVAMSRHGRQQVDEIIFAANGLSDYESMVLVGMNDSEAASFLEIADWIQQNVGEEKDSPCEPAVGYPDMSYLSSYQGKPEDVGSMKGL
jgi:hypothetical protein